jgi:hypothetical protein
MKKIFLGSFIWLFSYTLSAQVEVNLTQENSNPDFFEGHIPLVSLDIAQVNSCFYGDIGVKLKLSSFYADISAKLTYLNGMEEYMFTYNGTTANSIYKYKASKELKAMLGYMVLNKEVDTKITFHLRSVGKTSYVTKVDTKMNRFLMVDAGIRKGFTWVNGAGKDLVFVGVGNPEGYTAPEPDKVRTMMDYTIIQAGLSGGSMGYYTADIKDYGKRSSKHFIRYYLDALVLVSSSVDNVYNEVTAGINQQNKVYTEYSLDSSPRTKAGFCLGIAMLNIKGFGFNAGAEAAYVPGIAGDFNSNFCLSINTSISIAKLFGE